MYGLQVASKELRAVLTVELSCYSRVQRLSTAIRKDLAELTIAFETSTF